MPMNYEERLDIVDRICGMKEPNTFSFEEISKWREKGLLEFGDLFIIVKFGELWHSVVFMGDRWQILTGDYKRVEVSDEAIKDFRFVNKNYQGSPFQDFIKREGFNKFQELSEEDKIDVFTGNYFVKHLSETMDGLRNALEDVVEILKEAKETK